MIDQAAPRRWNFSAYVCVLCIVLAMGCFYFSLSSGLFAWFYPDELVASTFYQNAGFLGCVKNYYFHTTVNRVSADAAVCAMAQTAALFDSPFIGWVFSRLMCYIMIPVSIAFLLRSISEIPLKLSLIAALVLSAMVLFIISDTYAYMFGLSLAIYATATFTFFTLIALFPQSLQSQGYFAVFCLIYALNLNSHEVFLVISGFFIPLYFWYSTPNQSIIQRMCSACQDKRLWILLVIYVVSVGVTLLAPGLAIRQHLWPSRGTLLDGLVHAVLSLEEVIYFIAKSYFLVILTFLMGILFCFSSRGKFFPRYKFFYGFLFSVPWIYLFLVGFLIGLTPNLMMESERTSAFQWIEPFFRHSELLFIKKPVNLPGAFGVRQNLFLYMALFLDIFLIGFFLSEWVIRKFFIDPTVEKNRFLMRALFFCVALLFLFHPDGMGSLKILSVLASPHRAAIQNSSEKNKFSQPENIIQFLVPSGLFWMAWNHVLFPRNQSVRYQSAVVNLTVNHFLRMHRGAAISLATFDPVYASMHPIYRVVEENPWRDQIGALYEVSFEQTVVPFHL